MTSYWWKTLLGALTMTTYPQKLIRWLIKSVIAWGNTAPHRFVNVSTSCWFSLKYCITLISDNFTLWGAELLLKVYRNTKKYLFWMTVSPTMRCIKYHCIFSTYGAIWTKRQIFSIKCIKDPTTSFISWLYIRFANSCTRSSTQCRLKHTLFKSNLMWHLYFNHLPHLWNSLPSLDLNQSVSTIKRKLDIFLGSLCQEFHLCQSLYFSLFMSL